MTTDTVGIVHTIHVGEETDDGSLGEIKEYEGVVDAMNLPDGSVKFHDETGLKTFSSGRIVRVTVRGLDDASRYRCTECEAPTSDMIGHDRGETPDIPCPVCLKTTTFKRMDIDEV